MGAPPRLAGDDNGEATNLNAARAGRVSRAGSKAGRIIRMVRLVRLVKLYMLARRQNDKSHKQSKVGAKLSDLTTRRVIVVVLVMLIVVPVFSYSEDDFSEEFATDQLHVFNLVRPVRVLYAVRCAAPARGAGPSPWPRCVCVRAWRNKQSHWEAAIDQMKATFLYWEGNVDDPRLVKLNIAPTIASTFTVDKPEIYDDLRTGLAGNELKKVFYETQQGGTTYITEAWFDQKVGGAPARRVVPVTASDRPTDRPPGPLSAVASPSPPDPVARKRRIRHLLDHLCDHPAGGGRLAVHGGRAAAGAAPHREHGDAGEGDGQRAFAWGGVGGCVRVSAGEADGRPVSRVAVVWCATEPAEGNVVQGQQRAVRDERALGGVLGRAVVARARHGSAPRCSPWGAHRDALQLLENTVKKIGGLLRVGFGQAGAPIIATNLQSSEGAFNPMVEGQRIHAIFGFIYILKFAKITEVLEEDVLTFVNKISKVVHDVAMTWGGAPNKNLGDAYLLTWRLNDPDEVGGGQARPRGGVAVSVTWHV